MPRIEQQPVEDLTVWNRVGVLDDSTTLYGIPSTIRGRIILSQTEVLNGQSVKQSYDATVTDTNIKIPDGSIITPGSLSFGIDTNRFFRVVYSSSSKDIKGRNTRYMMFCNRSDDQSPFCQFLYWTKQDGIFQSPVTENGRLYLSEGGPTLGIEHSGLIQEALLTTGSVISFSEDTNEFYLVTANQETPEVSYLLPYSSELRLS